MPKNLMSCSRVTLISEPGWMLRYSAYVTQQIYINTPGPDQILLFPSKPPLSTKMASTQEPLASKDDGLKIIHAGLYRTGTMSMTEAYRILGYNPHHARDNLYTIPWPLVENATEATYPHIASLPNYTHKGPDGKPTPRPPFTREDWQALWGEFDVVTDIASTFALELMEAYPDAKVVVVQRNFESWWPSFKSELLQSIFDVNLIQSFIIRHVIRMRALDAMIKIHTGFFGVSEFSMAAIEPRARDVYEEYYSKVREAAGGRYLEYHLGDGWEPLCKFLGKDVPDVPFPRLNDRAEHAANSRKNVRDMTLAGLKVAGPVIAVVIGVAFYYWR